jgi:hypothetical protein
VAILPTWHHCRQPALKNPAESPVRCPFMLVQFFLMI